MFIDRMLAKKVAMDRKIDWAVSLRGPRYHFIGELKTPETLQAE